MFGYVNINQPELKIREYDRYRGYYCGLCRSLKQNYGITSRLSLSYDITFLMILLTSLYEPETSEKRVRCPFHPVHRHLELQNRLSDYCADMNILLTWYLSEDRRMDADTFRDKIAGSGLLLLYKRAFEKIKRTYPEKIAQIENSLCTLHQLEKENCQDLDSLSALSGQIVSEIFVPCPDEWADTLRGIGFHLGQFIYLMDAWEDVENDIRTGNFNPLLSIYNNETSAESFDEICRSYMTMVMADCARYFERLPLIEDAELLRNILYSGLWTRYEQIQSRRRKKQTEEGEPAD